MRHTMQVFAEHLDTSLTWDFVAWLRTITRLPILVKVRCSHAHDAASTTDCQLVQYAAATVHVCVPLDQPHLQLCNAE